MPAVAQVARSFIGISMVAFGIQHVVYADFVTRLVPTLPAWTPGQSYLAYLFGFVLIVAGGAMITLKQTRAASLVLGAIIFLSFLFLCAPRLPSDPGIGAIWTNAGKALALSGACFLVAGSLSQPADPFRWLYAASPFFLAVFLILGGVQHFLFPQFVATLVPSWIPWHFFWTYFAGVALIAGGIGIMIPLTRQLAAYLVGIMIFLWVITLHIPRALASIRSSNETTAVFEALALSGAAFLIAYRQRGTANRS